MDNLTPSQRSYAMSRVKSVDTGPERAVRSALHRRGLRFRKHVAGVAGRPDVVFPRQRVAVFIDGDFWHGYRFPVWEGKLTTKWRDKIAGNRRRDQRNFRKLRRMGWTVLRVWEHEIEADVEGAADRIQSALEKPAR